MSNTSITEIAPVNKAQTTPSQTNPYVAAHADLRVVETVFKDILKKPVWLINTANEKIPINPLTNLPAKINDSTTWTTFEKVKEYISAHPGSLPVLAITPDIGIVAIDIDNVRDGLTGDILPWAKQILDQVNSATEVSRSGKGLHIYVRGTKPGTRCKCSVEESALEMFDAHFITMTGNFLPDKPLIEDRQNALETIYNDYLPSGNEKAKPTWIPSPSMADEEVIEHCRKAKNKLLFEAMFDRGDTSQQGGDASAADLALVTHLAFYTQDPTQLNRLFRQSKLYRGKWDRDDYRERTVNKALNILKATYQPKTAKGIATEEKNLEQLAASFLSGSNSCRNLTLEGMPPVIKNYVEEMQRVSDAALPMLLASCMACISAHARNTYVEYFGKLRPNLYQLVLSKSGSFKTTALQLGCAVIYEEEKKLAADLASTLKSIPLKNKAEQESARLEALTQRAKSSKLLANKTTPERLFIDMSRGHKGVLPISEFGGWLKDQESSYNKTLRSIYTDFYDCPTYYEIKTVGNQDSPIVITDSYISIIGYSARAWLEGQISNKDIMTGFFSRYLIFDLNEPFTIPKPFPEGDPFVIPPTFRDCLNRVERCEGEYRLSEKAREVYEQIYYSIYEVRKNQKENGELLDPFVKRWCPSIIKVALLLHLMEDPSNREIQARHIVTAGRYVAVAIQSTQTILRSGLLSSEFQRNCTRVLEYIASKGGSATRKQILASRKIRMEHGNDGARAYDEVLEYLLETGHINVSPHTLKLETSYSLLKKADGEEE